MKSYEELRRFNRKRREREAQEEWERVFEPSRRYERLKGATAAEIRDAEVVDLTGESE